MADTSDPKSCGDCDKCNPKGSYSPTTVSRIRFVYGLAILFWIILILTLRLYVTKVVWFLVVPLIFFILGFINASVINSSVEDEMFKASYLSLGLILALALFTWMSKDYKGNARQFTTIVIIALTLSLLTVIDVWMSKQWLTVYKHAKSCMQTMSICLLIYAMLLYCTNRTGVSLP